MSYVNTDILMDIITDHDLCQTQKDELMKVINMFNMCDLMCGDAEEE